MPLPVNKVYAYFVQVLRSEGKGYLGKTC